MADEMVAAAPETSPAPAAPAASEAPAAAPASSEAAPIAGPTESESSAQFITRAMDEQKKNAKPEVDPLAPVELEKKVDPVPAAEPVKEKTPEEIAAEAEKLAKEQPAEDEEEFQLEPVGPLPPKELAAKLKENPELAAALEKAGLKDSMFAASRLAQRVAGFEQIFPDIEAAKYAAQTSQDFSVLADQFTNIKDNDSARTFMQSLLPFSYVLDEDGKPRIDPNTNLPVNDGSVGRFMDNVLGMVLDYQENQAKEGKDEDLLAAIDLLKARTGRSPASADEEQLTEEQKKEASRLKTEREAINLEKSQAQELKSQEFETNVAKDIESEVDKLVDNILSKADLDAATAKYLKTDIKESVFGVVQGRKDFFMQLDALMRRPMSDKVRKERVGLALRTIKSILPETARAKLKEAGVKIKTAQAEKDNQSAAREQQNRSEQRGAGRPAAPTQQPTDVDMHAQAMKEFKEQYHREPSTSEALVAFGKVKAKYSGGR